MMSSHYPTPLTRAIMRRVYAVFFLRALMSPVAVKCGILLVLAFVFAERVYVRMVITNALAVESPSALVSYFIHAFSATTTLVQGVILLGVVVLGLMVSDILRAIRLTPLSQRRAL